MIVEWLSWWVLPSALLWAYLAPKVARTIIHWRHR